jgi:hypothetical protein
MLVLKASVGQGFTFSVGPITIGQLVIRQVEGRSVSFCFNFTPKITILRGVTDFDKAIDVSVSHTQSNNRTN